MLKLTLLHGQPFYVEPASIAAAYEGQKGGGTFIAIHGCGNAYAVRDPVDEIVRLIEEAAHPTTDAACAALVEAARRVLAWLDLPGPTHPDPSAIIVKLRSALAAMEVR
ncbi:MAG: hypothetical protein ABFD65_15005 [Candidatus Polarisedimenticolia bacterium]